MSGRAAFGASRPLAGIPAKVRSLNPQRSLPLRGGKPVTVRRAECRQA